MTPLVLRLASILAALGGVLAQSEADNDRAKSSSKVWATVAFVNHGEITPALGYSPSLLTPQGAQQMHRQGAAFRQRYLTTPESASNSSTSSPMQNIERDAIDNRAINVLSKSETWASSCALAFLQGLYPPNTKAFASYVGAEALAEDYPANGTFSYPLDGYQYPGIKTPSKEDSVSVSFQGDQGCRSWNNASGENVGSDPAVKDKASASNEFYQRLFSTAPLQGTVEPSIANFAHAHDIYQLVNYLYTHNETVYKGLEDAPKTLQSLREYAFALQSAQTQASSSNSNDTQSVVKTLPGRTLAHAVAVQLEDFVTRGDFASKMTLMFGSYEPLMAFFSVAGLLTRDNVENGPMGNVTASGATIVFELIGENSEDSNSMPGTEDLRVRFLYRATADKDAKFEVYSLFGSGFDGNSIPYTAFLREMKSRGRDAVDWCELCDPVEGSTWCSSTTSATHEAKSRMNPAVAGVIGAIIMGGLVALVGLGLFCLGGYGIQRNRSGERFKGPEKRPGDRDVQVGNEGDHQERIGSWEMRDGHAAKASGGDALASTDHQRNPFDDDYASDIGAAPVKARESV